MELKQFPSKSFYLQENGKTTGEVTILPPLLSKGPQQVLIRTWKPDARWKCESQVMVDTRVIATILRERRIVISSPVTEHGRAQEWISVMMYGLLPAIHLDYKNLSNAVQACATDEVVISVHPAKNGYNLVTVKPVDGEQMTCLLAPVRIGGE
jgi:hypothetical protein